MKISKALQGILFIVLMVSHFRLFCQDFSNNQVLYPDSQETPLVWSDLAVDGEFMVLGSASSSKYGTSAGQAFVYQFIENEWVFVLELKPTEYRTSHYYGKSVDIQGDIIIVATQASYYEESKYNEVYVYKRDGSTWTNPEPIATLSPSTFGQNSMGESVKISGSVILAGDADYSYTNETDGTRYSGKVYVFEKNDEDEWTDMNQSAELVVSLGGYSNGFGNAMDISDDLIVVAAYDGPNTDTDRGAVFIYEKTSEKWESSAESVILKGNDPLIYFGFGMDVELRDNHLFVSTRTPEIYVFEHVTGASFSQKAILSLRSQHAIGSSFYDSKMHVTESSVYLGMRKLKINDIYKGGIFVFNKGADWTTKFEDGLIYPESNSNDLTEFATSIGGNMDQIMGIDGSKTWIFSKTDESYINSSPIHEIKQNYLTSFQNYFGRLVAISGRYAVVKSEGPTSFAYVYYQEENGNWNQIEKIELPGSTSISSLAIYGYTIAIGSSGGVYIYQIRDGVLDGENFKFITSTQQNATNFGRHISLCGGTLAISAQTTGTNGKALIFIYENEGLGSDIFIQRAIISPPDLFSTNSESPRYLVIDDERLAVHIYKSSGGVSTDPQYVLIYDKPKNGWSSMSAESAKLVSGLHSYGLFGGIALSDSLIVVANFKSNSKNSRLVSFDTELMDIQNPVVVNGTSTSNFGYTIDRSGEFLLTSNRYYESQNQSYSNQALLFHYDRHGNHDSLTTFFNPLPEPIGFGESIAIYGHNIFIGAPKETGNGDKAGAVYTFVSDQPFVKRVFTDYSGLVELGDEVRIFVEFSEPVVVTGEPAIYLNLLNRNDGKAIYTSGSGTNLLTLTYAPSGGDVSPLLNYRNENSFYHGSIVSVTDGIRANRVMPPLGVEESLAASAVVSVDSGPPTATWMIDSKDINSNVVMGIQFNRPVTGLSSEDFIVTNGAITGVEDLDGMLYHLSFSPSVEGVATLELNSGGVMDAYGLTNLESEKLELVYDITPPMAEFDPAEIDYTSSYRYEIEMIVSDDAYEIDINDFSTLNMEIIDLRKDRSTYYIDVVLLNQGPTQIKLDAGILRDKAGNVNQEAFVFQLVRDSQKPIVQIISGPKYLVNGPFELVLSISEELPQFGEYYIGLSNLKMLELKKEALDYTIQLEPTGISGSDLYFSLSESLADEAGNKIGPFLLKWKLDNVPPSASIYEDLGASTYHELNLQFSEPVTSLMNDFFELRNISEFYIQPLQNNLYHISILPSSNSSFGFTLKGDVVFDNAGNPALPVNYNATITGILDKSLAYGFEWISQNNELIISSKEGIRENFEARYIDLRGNIVAFGVSHGQELTLALPEAIKYQMGILMIFGGRGQEVHKMILR